MTIRCLNCRKVLLKNVLVHIGELHCRHCKEVKWYEVTTDEGLKKLKQM